MNNVAVQEKSTKSAWRNPFAIALLVYYLVMAVVGLLIPDDVLKTNAWAREFSDFMASIVPQIDRITALGIKPDVNRFYFSVLWVGSPVLILISLLLIWRGRGLGFPLWMMPFGKASIRVVGVIFMVGWSQFLWAVQPNMGLTKLLFFSDFGRGVYSQIVFFTAPTYFLAGIFAWLLGWLTGYIPRNIERARQRHG